MEMWLCFVDLSSETIPTNRVGRRVEPVNPGHPSPLLNTNVGYAESLGLRLVVGVMTQTTINAQYHHNRLTMLEYHTDVRL